MRACLADALCQRGATPDRRHQKGRRSIGVLANAPWPGRTRPGKALRGAVRVAAQHEYAALERESRDGSGNHETKVPVLASNQSTFRYAARRNGRPAEGRRLRDLLQHQRVHVSVLPRSEICVRRASTSSKPEITIAYYTAAARGMGQGTLPEAQLPVSPARRGAGRGSMAACGCGAHHRFRGWRWGGSSSSSRCFRKRTTARTAGEGGAGRHAIDKNQPASCNGRARSKKKWSRSSRRMKRAFTIRE